MYPWLLHCALTVPGDSDGFKTSTLSPKRQSLSIHVGPREHVGARSSQATKSVATIECNLSESVEEGSDAVTTPNGVGNVMGVAEIVTQSPSVVNADVTE